jgi:hypothetical protein
MQEAQDYPTAHAYVLTKFPDQSQKQKPYIKLEEI